MVCEKNSNLSHDLTMFSCISSLLCTPSTIYIEKLNKYKVLKCDANAKLSLNLGWFKYVHKGVRFFIFIFT
jgi:hypothetical protein